jgi:hypothetical protein
MKKILIIIIFAFFLSCVQKDERLYKKVDSINLQLKTIYSRLDSTIITKKDLLKDNEYNVLIWKRK